jgi:Tol biopolymer transport system component
VHYTPTGYSTEKVAASIPWKLIDGRIAYRNSTSAKSSIYTSNEIFIIDGHTKKVLSIAKSNLPNFYDLAWSKDGSRMIFKKFVNEKGRWQLFELNLRSREQNPIYPSIYHNGYPAWSNDGRLAYTDVWLGIRIDGEPFYFKQAANTSRPAWSPDGKYLVASVQDSTSQGALYKISLRDTTAVPLLQGKGEYNNEIFYDPLYSPDGSKIVYIKTAYDEGVIGEVWIMNEDGSDQKKLTSGHGDRFPVWSPDGNKILFERNVRKLYIINNDGSGLTLITESRLTGTSPVWIP